VPLCHVPHPGLTIGVNSAGIMPVRPVAGTEIGSWLIPFDKNGNERPFNGTKVSEELRHALASASPSLKDAFLLLCHWNNDFGGRHEQLRPLDARAPR
jgi:hypothetical protein